MLEGELKFIPSDPISRLELCCKIIDRECPDPCVNEVLERVAAEAALFAAACSTTCYTPFQLEEIALVRDQLGASNFCLLLKKPTELEIEKADLASLDFQIVRGEYLLSRIAGEQYNLILGSFDSKFHLVTQRDIAVYKSVRNWDLSDGADFFILNSHERAISELRLDPYIDVQSENVSAGIGLAKLFGLEIYCGTVIVGTPSRGAQYPILTVSGSRQDEQAFLLAWELFCDRHIEITPDRGRSNGQAQSDSNLLTIVLSSNPWHRHLVAAGGRIGKLY